MSALPLASSSFDLAFSTFGSFLVLDDEGAGRTLDELARVLRPEGMLVLEMPTALALEELHGLREWSCSSSSWAWEGPHMLLTENEVHDEGCRHRRIDRILVEDGDGRFVWASSLPPGDRTGLAVAVQTSRIWQTDELLCLLDERGFDHLDAAGDWEGTPLDDDGPRMVIRASKR